MKKYYIVIFILVFSAFACTKNVWITDHAVRPKKPKFKILKRPFNGNALINNSYLYISKRKFLNYDGRKIILYVGFYSDGKMIVDKFWENEMLSTLSSRNSWQTAASVGYYTTTNDRIVAQFFVSQGGGEYMIEKGKIKPDTIILERPTHFRLKTEMEFDTLARSSFPLK